MLTPQFPWWPGHGSDQCMHYILLFTYGWAHRLSLRPNIMYHTIANDLKPLLLGNVQEFLCHTDSERTRETKRIFCLLEWKCQFPVPSGTACTAWKISRFLQTVVPEMISTYFCNNSLILFEDFFCLCKSWARCNVLSSYLRIICFVLCSFKKNQGSCLVSYWFPIAFFSIL